MYTAVTIALIIGNNLQSFTVGCKAFKGGVGREREKLCDANHVFSL